MLAALNSVPLGVAVLFGEFEVAGRYAIVLLALLALALPLSRMTAPGQLQMNEAMTVVVLVFLLGSLVSSYSLGAASDKWLDSWFEAVSGITTTGLSTMGSVEDKPRAFLFARSWMQWYGGLGIVVLSLVLFLRNSVAARRLMDIEATGETLVSTTQIYARRIAIVYGILTVCALTATWLVMDDGFVALLHSLSAVSTGGFSTFDNSLARLEPLAAGVLMGFAWLGAVSLPLYFLIWQKGPSALLHDLELRALLIATAVLAGLLYLWLPANGHGWPDALLMGMSAQSTTGFSTLAVSDLDDASKLAMIGSMLAGGSVGSTAGGFKLLRLLLLLRLLQLLLARAAAPRHAVIEARLGARRIADEDLWRAMLLMVMFMLLIFLSWLAFVAHGYPPLDALFEVVSASATVGLSTGITRPDLEPFLKVLLCFDMLAGRIEIFALLVVLYPGTWFGERSGAL
ncbi:cation transporter [Kineobactrum sediminis]|uniref:Cation transporter n=1 Tax=Kineobactrum sediminis TaxID=1905677 RepID=A0A2N5XZC1_9GAMM|nr:cation transporter [Kineobactrum sediminis]